MMQSVKLLIFLAVACLCNFEVCSQPSDSLPNTSLKKLPYPKTRELSYLSLNISGGVAVETQNFDNTYLVSLTPRLHKYLSRNLELTGDCTFILQKLGNAAGRKKIIYNQLSSLVRFFPFKKTNIIYLESGAQLGNYALLYNVNDELIAIKKWHPDVLFGFGIELLPKKMKRIFDFEVRCAFPLDNSLNFDFTRMIGFGTRISL